MISLAPPLPTPAPRSNKPISLAACQRLLQATLGVNAPALITLRRHAKAGLLDSCRHPDAIANPSSRGRGRYVPSAIVSFYRDRAGMDPHGVNPDDDDDAVSGSQGQGNATPTAEPSRSGAVAHEITPELLAALQALRKDQAQIRSILSDLGERITGLSAQVRDLNAVRSALMMKYDAAAAAAHERAERLEQENRTLRRMEDPNARVLARIQMDLAKALEKLMTGGGNAH